MAWSGLTLPKRPLHDTVSIPVAERNLPDTALPSWSRLPWDAKLPMPRCPKGEVPLSRGLLCEGIYRKYPHHQYNLWDPNNFKHPGDTEYSGLSDGKLGLFFLKTARFRKLQEHNEITRTGEVICGLKTYNQYRHYLYNIWTLEVNRLVKRQITEEKLLQEALHSNVLVHGTSRGGGGSATVARERWAAYQDELRQEFGDCYPDVSEWLQETTRCYRNATARKVARQEEKEAKLRQKWEMQRKNDLKFFEEECRIRRDEAFEERRRKDRRLREYQKQWNAHDRKVSNRKARRKRDFDEQCKQAEAVVRKFREKLAKELDEYEEREGINYTTY